MKKRNIKIHNYYIYKHIHPSSKEVVYIGCGSGGRAWATTTRDYAHQEWIKDVVIEYGIQSYVDIVLESSCRKTALLVEKQLLEEKLPRFNKCVSTYQYVAGKGNEAAVRARQEKADVFTNKVSADVWKAYQQGKTLRAAGELLESWGIPAPAGDKWHASTVKRFLIRTNDG